VILAASVFEISCGKTDKHYMQTPMNTLPPATASNALSILYTNSPTLAVLTLLLWLQEVHPACKKTAPINPSRKKVD